MKTWSQIRRGWESRFPHLDEDWTHWWLEGDGNFLILIEGCSLTDAIEYVFEYCEVYISIKAYRAKYNIHGAPIREKASYEVANKNSECRPSYSGRGGEEI